MAPTVGLKLPCSDLVFEEGAHLHPQHRRLRRQGDRLEPEFGHGAGLSLSCAYKVQYPVVVAADKRQITSPLSPA